MGWVSSDMGKSSENKFSGNGVVLGPIVEGESLLPQTDDGELAVSEEELRAHMLFTGSPGMGKSGGLRNVVHQGAELKINGQKPQVIIVDPKGDKADAERIVGMMNEIDRETFVFPRQHLNGFIGDDEEDMDDVETIIERLMAIIPFTKDGTAGSWYGRRAENALRTACNDNKPFEGSLDLLRRLMSGSLKKKVENRAKLEGLTPGDFEAARSEYGNFFGSVKNRYDGSKGIEDCDALLVSIKALVQGKQGNKLLKFFFEDLKHYLMTRKDIDRPVLLVLDEFPVIADVVELEKFMDLIRSFNVFVVLSTQSMAGVGDQEARERLIAAVGVFVVLSGANTGLISAYAGTEEESQPSLRFSDSHEPEITLHQVDLPILKHEQILSLEKWEAWVVRKTSVARVKLRDTPEVFGELPAADPLENVVEQAAEPPKKMPTKKMRDKIKKNKKKDGSSKSKKASKKASKKKDEPSSEQSESTAAEEAGTPVEPGEDEHGPAEEEFDGPVEEELDGPEEEELDELSEPDAEEAEAKSPAAKKWVKGSGRPGGLSWGEQLQADAQAGE